jgi:class 3 adenylate cyclase/CheY-like chemotaxis protein
MSMTTILVIEDEINIRLGVEEFLKFENFDVLIAENGKRGLELAFQHTPDLILCDVMMPEMDGYGVLDILRRNHQTQNIPFIFLTAKDDHDSRHKGMVTGADDYVTKPFKFDELLSTINARLVRQKTLLSDVSRQIDELNMLRQIDQELSTRLNPDWIVSMMMDWALRRTGANSAIMGTFDENEPFLILSYIAGKWDTEKAPQKGDRWALEGIIGTAARSEKPVQIDDVEALGIKPANPKSQSLLGVPLTTSERRLGLVLLESSQKHAFKSEDLTFLAQIANRAAMALEQSSLFQILLQQHQQERELREIFGRFVSRDVAEVIRTGEINPAGENLYVAVLFCDIRDFTALSERLAPKEVLEILNDYLPLVVEAAHRNGGMVNKFGGDSTLIVFGAPMPLERSSYRAVRAALQIRNRLEELNKTKFITRDFSLKVGIGINTGEVVAGLVGPKERQEYTVIGDTVNLSSRIQALNKEYPQYDVLISDSTYTALEDRKEEFEVIDLGDVAIRGKTNAVKVWGVADLAKSKSS